jgi:hypothetical protein
MKGVSTAEIGFFVSFEVRSMMSWLTKKYVVDALNNEKIAIPTMILLCLFLNFSDRNLSKNFS